MSDYAIDCPILINKSTEELLRLTMDCDGRLMRSDLENVSVEDLEQIKWRLKEALGHIYGIRQALKFD